MKQGSTDDPFADDPSEAREESGDESDSEKRERGRSTDDTLPGDPDRQTRRSLPYIHARDGVKDGRTQRPVFLRDDIEAGIDELVDRMEDEFGEDVYKTDVTEAAMAVAQESPGLVADKLEEWGYGWA